MKKSFLFASIIILAVSLTAFGFTKLTGIEKVPVQKLSSFTTDDIPKVVDGVTQYPPGTVLLPGGGAGTIVKVNGDGSSPGAVIVGPNNEQRPVDGTGPTVRTETFPTTIDPQPGVTQPEGTIDGQGVLPPYGWQGDEPPLIDPVPEAYTNPEGGTTPTGYNTTGQPTGATFGGASPTSRQGGNPIPVQSSSLLDQIIPPSLFGNSEPLNRLFNQLFYIGLVVAIILAIVMIIRGGVEYMTIDAISSKENGKNRVKAALGGLLLAFSAILILNTINPGLTSLKLVFPTLIKATGVDITNGISGSTIPGTPGATSTSPSTLIPPGSGKSEEEVRAYFAQNGIAINAAAGQTNMQGLGDAAMTGVVNLKNASGASVTITGGTEPGHATHGIGKSIVDLRKDSRLDAYIINNAQTNYPRGSYTEYKHANGATYMNEGDHWHVEY